MSASWVRAENDTDGRSLPEIPPLEGSVAVRYALPAETSYGVVRLLHQTASKEYIEFLRDENPNAGDPNNNGQILYDLWEASNRSAPETMAELTFAMTYNTYLPSVSTP